MRRLRVLAPLIRFFVFEHNWRYHYGFILAMTSSAGYRFCAGQRQIQCLRRFSRWKPATGLALAQFVCTLWRSTGV